VGEQQDNDLTEAAVRLALQTRREDIGDELWRIAGDGFVDGIAVMLAGQTEQAAKLVRDYVQRLGTTGVSTVVGSALKTAPAAAALANGTSAHAHDFDDTQLSATPDRVYGLMSHPTAPVLGAALPAAEMVGASGRETLLAYLVGVEITCRVCDAIEPSHYLRGFHSTSTAGVFGATAAASRLFGLSEEQMQCALGLAASMSSGIRGNFGYMAKPLHAGRSAESGVVAALLAKAGFTAQRNTFEAADGFFKTFGGENFANDPAIVEDPLWGYRKSRSAGYDKSRFLKDLGSRWAFQDPGISIKPYPSVVLSHPSMTTLLTILNERQIKPSAIEKINVYAGPTVLRLKYGIPKSGTEGKFSLLFCLALIAVQRSASLRDFTDDAVLRPDLKEMMDRVALLPDAEIAALGYSVIASRVEVILKDGTAHTRRSGPYKGGPGDRLTAPELEAKFRQCAAEVLAAGDIDAAYAAARDVASLSDIRHLTEVLVAAN
jgi:2-methylcitrate dehydratase PrpD